MFIRTYSDLRQLPTFSERFKYLSLIGQVAEETFGTDRYLNQRFYRSVEWRDVRDFVISRDRACDLATPGYEIHADLYVHHMNPITVRQLVEGDPSVLDPVFLITTTHKTHNAIHYGNESSLPRGLVERRPGDTKLW